MLTARPAIAAVLAATMLAAACSSSTGTVDLVEQSAARDEAQAAQSDDSPEPSLAASTPLPATPVPTATPQPTPTPPPPLVDAETVAQIELGVEAGSNPRYPRLTWSAVELATEYTLTVFDAERSPWWSWSGDETTAILGGIEGASGADFGGPSAGPGVTWWVVAYDADGALVGASGRELIDE